MQYLRLKIEVSQVLGKNLTSCTINPYMLSLTQSLLEPEHAIIIKPILYMGKLRHWYLTFLSKAMRWQRLNRLILLIPLNS